MIEDAKSGGQADQRGSKILWGHEIADSTISFLASMTAQGLL